MHRRGMTACNCKRTDTSRLRLVGSHFLDCILRLRVGHFLGYFLRLPEALRGLSDIYQNYFCVLCVRVYEQFIRVALYFRVSHNFFTF